VQASACVFHASKALITWLFDKAQIKQANVLYAIEFAYRLMTIGPTTAAEVPMYMQKFEESVKAVIALSSVPADKKAEFSLKITKFIQQKRAAEYNDDNGSDDSRGRT